MKTDFFMESEVNNMGPGIDENDLLNILKESALYLELTPDEQNVLLQHVAEFYHSRATGGLAEYTTNKVA